MLDINSNISNYFIRATCNVYHKKKKLKILYILTVVTTLALTIIIIIISVMTQTPTEYYSEFKEQHYQIYFKIIY